MTTLHPPCAPAASAQKDPWSRPMPVLMSACCGNVSCVWRGVSIYPLLHIPSASFPSPAHFHLCSSFRQCLEDVQSSLLWRESNFICPLPRWIFRVSYSKTNISWSLNSTPSHPHRSSQMPLSFSLIGVHVVDIFRYFHTLPSHSCCLTNHY